jgi:hypothetical protein
MVAICPSRDSQILTSNSPAASCFWANRIEGRVNGNLRSVNAFRDGIPSPSSPLPRRFFSALFGWRFSSSGQ